MDLPRPQIHWFEELARRGHYREDVNPRTKPRHCSKEDTARAFAALKEEDVSPNILSPYRTAVSACILDLATEVTVTLYFSNPTDTVIRQGYFSFPVPSGSSLTKFRFFIGDDKVLHSKAKPSTKAVADFQGAIHNLKAAALVKQDTPEIFTAGLGNLPPRSKLKAEVSLVLVLKEKIANQHQQLPTRISSLTIPTYIAPRYGTPPDGFLDATAPRSDIQHTVSLTVEAVFADEVIDVVSKTHDVSFDIRPGPRPCHDWSDFTQTDSSQAPSYLVTVKLKKPLVVLDGDFVLDFVARPQKETSVPRAFIETHPSMNDNHAILLTVPSTVLLDKHRVTNDSEILFLADRSGSMADKMPSVKSAMMFFLKGIPLDRRFNVWSFGSHYSSLWTESQSKSQATIQRAVEHVENDFNSDMGGTELLPALKAIFESRSAATVATTDIILLTDGEVWRQEETIEFVNSAREHSGYRVRFFCLGIGPAVSHALVEGIARAGGGYAEVVPANEQSGWEDRVVLMLKSALLAHIGPLKLEIGEETSSGFRPWNQKSYLQSPSHSNTLSPFVTNKVLMLFEETGLPVHRATILLKTVRSTGDEEVRKIKLALFQGRGPIIHTIGARELLRDLEHDRHWLVHASEDSIRREGERIACKWSLLSKWTCLVAVEGASEKLNALPDEILDSIRAVCEVRPPGWDPDLLKTVGPARTALAFRKRKAIEAESESESDDNSDVEDAKKSIHRSRRPRKDDPEGDADPGGFGSGPPASGPHGSGRSGSSSSKPSQGGETEGHGNQPSSGTGGTKSFSARGSHTSAADHTAPALTLGYLQSLIGSLGWPPSLHSDDLRVQAGAVERPCAILGPDNSLSRPASPAAYGLQPLATSRRANRRLRARDRDRDHPMMGDITKSIDNELDTRALVGSLVGFQSFDGSFDSMEDPESELVSMFGENIRPALGQITDRISLLLASTQRPPAEQATPTNQPEAKKDCSKVALTILIIALLGKHFDSCQSLCILLIDNAKQFVSSWTAQELWWVSVEELVRIANKGIEGIEVRIRKQSHRDDSSGSRSRSLLGFTAVPQDPSFLSGLSFGAYPTDLPLLGEHNQGADFAGYGQSLPVPVPRLPPPTNYPAWDHAGPAPRHSLSPSSFSYESPADPSTSSSYSLSSQRPDGMDTLRHGAPYGF